MEKLTIEDLLGYAKSGEKRSFKVALKEFGGKEVECHHLTPTEFIEIVSGHKGGDAESCAHEIIYAACDIFHEEKLIAEMKCLSDPPSVVTKVLPPRTVLGLAMSIIHESGLEGASDPSEVVAVIRDEAKKP